MKNIWLERPMLPEFAAQVKGIAHVLPSAGDTPEDPLLHVAEAHAIIAGGMRYGAEVMDRAPKLKLISRTGIGVDTVDIPAATARGIAVCNAPEGPTISTAEQALMLMLAVAKNSKLSERRLREQTGSYYGPHDAIELYQKTLGLIGFGRIARRVARVCQALGMTVIAYDPYLDQAAMSQAEVTPVGDLATLLGQADVISVHVPLTPESHHLMNAERFAQMKPHAIFINTARGGLVDEQALTAALERGHLFGAGLDVTEPEPALGDNPLLHMDNVIVTPHVASATRVGKARIYQMALEQVLQALRGERPQDLLNPEVWPLVFEA